jgi:hypothetical protein
MPSRCCVIVVLISPTSRLDSALSLIPDLLAFRDLGDDGLSKLSSGLELDFFTPLDNSENSEMAVLWVRFEEALECA